MTTFNPAWGVHHCPCDGDDPGCPRCADRLIVDEYDDNRCICGEIVPGFGFWTEPDEMPTHTCRCGLHYVHDGDEVAIYATDADGPDLVAFAELVERGELGGQHFATPTVCGERPARWLNPPRPVR